MLKRSTLSLLAVFLMLGVSAEAKSQDGEGWMHRGMGGGMEHRLLAMLDNDRVKSELGLTDEQSGRLRQLVVENQKAGVKTRSELQLRGIELREMLRADNPDRSAVLKKVQEISDLRGQMMKQHIDALLTAKTILSPEQQKKIHAMMQEHRSMNRGPRFGEGPGQRGFRHGPPADHGPESGFPHTPPEPPVQ